MSCINSECAKTNLLQEWEVGFNAFSAAFEEGINYQYAKFRKEVLHRFVIDSVHFARLNDEAVYVKLLELMGVYKKIVLEGRIESGISPNAKTLLDGICEVLVSRLSQFFAKFPSGLGSPVRTEKIQIIEEAVIIAAKKIDEAADIKSLGANAAEFLMLPHAQNAVNVELPKEVIEKIYCVYTEELLTCLVKLDDLHSRKIAGFFMDLLEREWEELGNIIKVQVGALEELTAEGDPVTKVLGMLREVYQHLGPVIEDYKKLFASQRAHPKSFISKDDFFDISHGLKISIEYDDSEFAKLLKEESKNQTGKLFSEFAKATYNVKRLISGVALLAGEITKTFESLLEKLHVTSEDSTSAIILGIKETIEIKISSLRESISEFEENGEKLVRDLGLCSQSFDLTDEIMEKIADSIKHSWLAKNPKDSDKFFEDCISGEEFLPLRESIEKIIDSHVQKIEKNLLAFKKEVLLYEICTYEEILTHSVPKLESSECESVLSAAAFLRDIFKELEVILKKNNITVIRPRIHSEFNAKEHEVIVAEKNENFAKGEIIKVLTAGYLYKNNVVLRANVIAAR